MRNRSHEFMLGVVLVIVFAGIALVSLFYTPQDAYAMQAAAKMRPPSLEFLFGTDNFGRDIFSRTMIGIRFTLIFSGLALLGSGVIGITIGLICARVGKVADQIIIRIVDTVNAIPPILLALVLMSVLEHGNFSLVLSLVVVFVPTFVRMTRNEAMQIRELEYIQHAHLLGAGHLRIMFRHILPNMWPSIVSTAIIVVTNSILVESALSYLGIGIQPPVPSLGRMMYDAQNILLDAPWAALLPGLCVVLIIVGFNCLGTGVEEGKGESDGN